MCTVWHMIRTKKILNITCLGMHSVKYDLHQGGATYLLCFGLYNQEIHEVML